VVIAAQAIACSIPVFRYALENWRPDPYTAFVLHQGELTTEHQKLIDTLRSTNFAGTTSANLIVGTVDLDSEPDERSTQIRKENADITLPCLVVQTPGKSGQPQSVFSSELTATGVAQLIGSPLRVSIADRLLKGDSVVWVYLESGVTEDDDETFAMLNKELVRLQSELKLPEIEDEDLDELSASAESLRIQFSAVRLSRDDVQESAFRDMLLHVEHDLLDESYVSQPMAFPIFGRGRALYALVGEGLAPDLIEEACRFLTGACQCTVKAENPGVDILMQVDWDKFIQPTEAVDASLPPLAGFSGFGQGPDGSSSEVTVSQSTTVAPEEDRAAAPAKSESDAVPPPESTANDATAVVAQGGSEATSSSSNAVWQNAIYVLMLAGAAVGVATLFLVRRSGG